MNSSYFEKLKGFNHGIIFTVLLSFRSIKPVQSEVELQIVQVLLLLTSFIVFFFVQSEVELQIIQNHMFKRVIEEEILKMSLDYPVVTVLGPRQSGKTTLVKKIFPNKPYINLENIDLRELAKKDPRLFLSNYPNGAVLDEVQNVPELTSYIQVIVDEKDQNGLFILTGSQQLQVHKAVSQSLAGRTAIFTLLPMSMRELELAEFNLSLDEHLFYGGYPRVFKKNLDPTANYRYYFQTYIERDLRQLIKIKDLSQFQKFIKVCAGRIGQLLNLESVSNDIGVSANTIKEWLSVLEASFVVFRLPPYYENFGKRYIKSPKIYFTDTGFAAYLLNIENIDQIKRDPLRGHLIENQIILEFLKSRLNANKDAHLYFFRDVSGYEIDLILEKGKHLIPIEIKAAQTFNSSQLKNLNYYNKLAQERVEKSFLIYTGESLHASSQIEVLNYKELHKVFADR